MVSVQGVHAEITGDSTDLNRALRRAETRMERFGRQVKTVARGVAGVTAAAGAGAVAVATFTQRIAQSADQIGKAAQTAGVTTSQIQELRFAFGQLAGTTDREVDSALRRFNRRIGLARQGSARYQETFEALNVTMSQSTPRAIEATLRALGNVTDAADRAALASEVFGEDAGPALAGALANGIQSVDDLREALNRDGGVISAENIQAAESFNDEMDRLSRIVSAEMADAVLDNADAYESLAEALGTAASLGARLVGVLPRLGSFIGTNMAAGPFVDPEPQRRRANADPMAAENPGADVPIVSNLRSNGTPAIIGLAGGAGGGAGGGGAGAPAPGINPTVNVRPQGRPAPGISPQLGEFSTQTPESQQGIFSEGAAFLEQAGLSEDALDKIRERMREREEMEQRHLGNLLGIREDTMRDLDRFTEMSYENQARTVASALGQMTSSVARESELMFNINKAAALAEGAIQAKSAVMGAYKVGANIGGPPVGAAFAAAAGAAQAANLAAIASQSFSSGGAAPSVGSTAAPPVSPVSAGGGAPAAGGGAQEPGQTLTVEGVDPDALFSGNQVRALAERLVEFQRNGGQVVFSEA